MEIPPKLLLQAIGAIYDGTISGTTNYPLYFLNNGKDSEYYAYRLRDVLPTRLLARFYYAKKGLIGLDLLWLADGIKSSYTGQAIFTIDRRRHCFDINGSPLNYILALQRDALINSCFSDFDKLEGFLEKIVIGSIKNLPPKLSSSLHIDFSRIKSPYYAFSRCFIKAKNLSSSIYRDDIVNALLALIDVIHQSLEILLKEKKIENEETIFCIRCGTKIPASSYYCPFCGAKQ